MNFYSDSGQIKYKSNTFPLILKFNITRFGVPTRIKPFWVRHGPAVDGGKIKIRSLFMWNKMY
jgi:hypothetical protein